MTKKGKLVDKLTGKGPFTWKDLNNLLILLGYTPLQGSGSRVKFHHQDPTLTISLHRPHPGNEIKYYARKQIIETLRFGGLI